MYTVKPAYERDSEAVYTANTLEECERFCSRVAFCKNYGLMRSWQIGDTLYRDCGPIVYKIEKVIDEAAENK